MFKLQSDDFNWNKLFDPDTDDIRQKETLNKIKAVGDAARKCLTIPEFQIYRDRYTELEKEIISFMITKSRNFNGDITKFGAEMLAVIVKTDTLRTLLKQVESDSRKETKE